MKKLFIFFLATTLFAACNNNNPFGKKDQAADKTDKEEKGDAEKKTGGLFGGAKNNDNNNWTNKQRNDWMNKCLDEFTGNSQAKKICSCVLDKVEQKYPDAKDAEEIPDAEGERIIKGCTAGINGDEEGYTRRGDGNDGMTGNENKNNWTDLQRQTFIQGCAGTAQQLQGFTAQQANSYCDCMTRKVEKRYSFEQAARLRAEDLQTQEWIDAAADCRARIY
jgi:hypothetical protein